MTRPARTSILFALLTGLFVGCLLWGFRPEFYDGDGYGYFMDAHDLPGSLNPHHLGWDPIVWMVLHLASVLHVDSIRLVQFVGVLYTACAATLMYLFLDRLDVDFKVSAVVVVFISLTPWTWHFSTQNQPYSLLTLAVALLLWVLAPYDEALSTVRVVCGALILVLAIGLHQAIVLWVPTIALYLWFAAPPKKRRPWVLVWTSVSLGFTAVGYLAGAYSRHITTLTGFRGWLTEYLRDQHAIQFHLSTTLLQSAVGLTRMVLQTDPIDYWLLSRYSSTTIAELYAAVFFMVVAVLCFIVYERKVIPLRSYPLWGRGIGLSLAILAPWGFFCLLWEPVNYYWFVGLIPFTCLVVAFLRSKSKARLAPIVLFMLVGIVWNLWANTEVDRYFSPGATPILVKKIMTELGKKDRFVIISRGESRNADYSPIGETLAILNRSNETAVIDDYVLVPSTSPWQQRFRRDIDHTIGVGAKVYCSKDLISRDYYDVAADVLSPYKEDDVDHLDSTSLFNQVQEILSEYYLVPSTFSLASDTYLEITPPARKQ